MENYLICWEECDVKHWEMVPKDEHHDLLLSLMDNPYVRKSSVFIVPGKAILAGIWLYPNEHKGKRVDFWNFFEDFGGKYCAPKLTEKEKKQLQKMKRQKSVQSKYGFISPDGRFFPCEYEGHASLADNICFGMVETNNSELYLERHGWCKIFKPFSDSDYGVYMNEKYVLTDAQWDVLVKMGLERAKGMEDILVKK